MKSDQNNCVIERVVMADLDNSVQPVKNLRDVFQIQSINSHIMQGLWFRSGDLISMHDALRRKLKTIISFRAREDEPHHTGTEPLAKHLHIPLLNDLNVYDLTNETTCRWLKDTIHIITQRTIAFQLPLLFHCFSGKDRTGVVAATLQTIMGVSKQQIINDYSNSDGHLFPDLFECFLDHLEDCCLRHISEDIASLKKFTSAMTNDPTFLSANSVHRISCGYLPRSIHLTCSSWRWSTDEHGRLSRCQGLITKTHPSIVLPPTQPLVVQHPCQVDIAYLRKKGFTWRPLVPECLGGSSSLFNEVFINEKALREYSDIFAKLMRRTETRQQQKKKQEGTEDAEYDDEEVSMEPPHIMVTTIDIRLHYYHVQGISRPDYIEVTLGCPLEFMTIEGDKEEGEDDVGSTLLFEIDNSIPV
jgi:hypothetical protein